MLSHRLRSFGSSIASQPSVTGKQLPTSGSKLQMSQAAPAQWVGVRICAGVQAPAWQASPIEHLLPSSQTVPLASAGFEQTPVDGAHTPAPWHMSVAPHTLGAPPTQTPEAQASTVVHRLPSLQVVPSASTGIEQAPVVESQVPFE